MEMMNNIFLELIYGFVDEFAYGIFVVIIVAIIILIKLSIVIVRTSEEKIVERKGNYRCTLVEGLNFINPLADRVVKTLKMKKVVSNFVMVNSDKKYNTIKIDCNIEWRINDSKKAYKIDNIENGLIHISNLVLKNIVKDRVKNEIANSIEEIKGQLRIELRAAEEDWGIRIAKVELLYDDRNDYKKITTDH